MTPSIRRVFERIKRIKEAVARISSRKPGTRLAVHHLFLSRMLVLTSQVRLYHFTLMYRHC